MRKPYYLRYPKRKKALQSELFSDVVSWGAAGGFVFMVIFAIGFLLESLFLLWRFFL